MMRRILRLKSASVLSCLMAALLVWPVITVVADNGNTFSGQATVVQVTVPPLGPTTIVLADTKPLPPTGGAQNATLLTASAPVPGVLALDAEVLHAATVANGNHSRSEASVANLALTTATGTTITADFLMSKAEAQCGPGGPSVSGSSEIVGLAINGQSISVSGQPNQTVPLPLGTGELIINEQNSSVTGHTGDITVNALHVIVNDPLGGPPIADVVISSAHADITCAPPPPPPPPGCQGDFITGGGWITGTPSGAKGNFAVAGGIKNGAFWGHLSYIDHGTGMKVKGTGVTAYGAGTTGSTSRHIEGTCEINGQPGTYKVDVADNGEPGRNDTFSLSLNGYTAGGNLQGGNIQLHNCN